LINSRWHSRKLEVSSFRGAECKTDESLVVEEVRERMAVNKQEYRSLVWRAK
jgi:hypothetical protein